MGLFDLEERQERVSQLEMETSQPDFWDDTEKAQETIRELNRFKKPLERHRELAEQLDEAKVLLELAQEEEEETLRREIADMVEELEGSLRQMKLDVLLDGRYDAHDAIVSVNPGAGGTESQDWAQMLMRMYVRWAGENGYNVQTLQLLEGEEAGIKSATLSVKGEYAYGYLKAERGIHRLVRISPFDSSGRRHTSFASVEVMPDIEEDDEVEINENDLEIDTFRASGAGGQHVNVTDSAVRIKHLPSGITVQCQNERSQHQNRRTAMRILRARLVDHKQRQREKELQEIRGEQREIAWGNQIRSYVLHPYEMVKDHRTEVETGNVEAVLEGEIDQFMEAYLEKRDAEAETFQS